MAISQVLSNALSGLRASARGTEIVSTNIANAMTEGYGVRRLNTAARDLGGLGMGVQVLGITRHSDPQILGARRIADAELGNAETRHSALKRVESLFGAAGDANSLSAKTARFESALTSAAADPTSTVQLGNTRDALSQVVDGIKHAATGIQEERLRADNSIGEQVNRLNNGLQQVDRLNDEITKTLQRGSDPSGLVDQRQQVIDGISEIVPLQQISRPGGRVALVSTMGETLVDHRPREFSFTPANAIDATMTLSGGALGKLSVDGRPFPSTRPFGGLIGGTLEASFNLRDESLPDAQKQLDQFTADLVGRLSDTAVDPTITTVGAGLIDAVGPINLINPTGLSGRIKVNDLLVDPTLLRDGLGALTPGPVGDATKLNGWLDNIQESHSVFTGGPSRSAAGHLADLSSAASSNRLSAETDKGYSSARHTAIREEELSLGVDTDLEMQLLLQLEKAYAANARVIQSADRMLQDLLEI